ncbi:MAG: response regulator, partial [Anaerolineae bacterium]|nr:response regulator [Anaerolineae bacterium]
AILNIMDQQSDIVLMDIRMPKLDGINALRIIHKLAPDISVISMTGQASQNDMAEAIKQGAYQCLLKPIRLEELFKAIMLTPGKDG